MPTLSDRKIRDEKPSLTDAGLTDKWISDGDGLYIRIRVNGTKTWVIRRQKNGKTSTETIGEFPAMDCKTARAEFAKRSFSPNLAKMTFSELLDEWYEKRIEPRYKVTRNIIVYVNRAKEDFGNTILGKLTAPELVRWLQAYAIDSPVAANRCSSNIKLALNYAVECGFIERNPLQLVTNRVVGGEEKTRDRVLTNTEIIDLWSSTHKHAPLLRFLLLTGLRIGEGQAARVEHLEGNIVASQ